MVVTRPVASISFELVEATERRRIEDGKRTPRVPVRAG